MKYKILENGEASQLSKSVTKYLEKGWELYGNPYHMINENGYEAHCQAIISNMHANILKPLQSTLKTAVRR